MTEKDGTELPLPVILTTNEVPGDYLNMSGNTGPTGDKGPPPAEMPTEKPKVTNPYGGLQPCKDGEKPRFTNPGQLVQTMCEYMTIIDSQNNSPNQKWKRWLAAGLNNPTITVNTMARVVKYPYKKDKNLKLVGTYMLSQLPTLSRFMRIVRTSKDDEPLCDVNRPVIVEREIDREGHIEKLKLDMGIKSNNKNLTYSQIVKED